jgi:hypothetical protein
MTPPDFSVLLLAWDDADPTVAVLGGAALPSTLPLVYQLAAQQPVLAVYPHLPAGEGVEERVSQGSPKTPVEPVTTASIAAPETAVAADAANAVAGSAATKAAADAVDALGTAVNEQGVQVFPALIGEKQMAVPALQSRIIGLAELETADAPAPAASAVSASPLAALLPALQPAASRSQWPTGIHAPALAGQWQAPAAPYLGAGSGGFFPPPPPAPPRPLAVAQSTSAGQKVAAPGFRQLNGVASSAAATSTPTTSLRPRQSPQAGDQNFDPDPELPAVQHPAAFQETTEGIGAGEAADISAPENDLVPDAPVAGVETEVPAVTATVPAPTPAPAEPAVPTVLMPRLDGLNFRMIQYARQAAQLVRGRSDFGVIYAPNWPAWLAALEIRNSSGRPLVLYLASLATDLPNPAEHGYQLEMERMAMRRARLVLVPDEALRRRLLALYEEAAGRVRVVAADDETAVQKALGEVAVG